MLSRGWLGILVVALAGFVPGGAGAWGRQTAPISARTATTLTVKDKAELHRIRVFGEIIIEEGHATGTLPGTLKARVHIDAARDTATAGFTLYARGGTLSGGSSGTAHGGRDGWESFSGRMWLKHGTGRYQHASGSGSMYGSIYRRTDRLIVQEIGRLRY